MIKKFIKFSASYVAINGIQRGMLFLMLPIFTHYMTPVEYGIVSTLLILISFFSIFFSLAIYASISRYYHKYMKKPEELREFLGSNFIFMTFISLFITIIFIFLSKPFFSHFFKEIKFNPYMIYAFIIISTQVIIVAYFSLLKAMQKLKLYAIVSSSYFILQLTLMSIMIIFYNMKHDGYLIGILLSNIIFIPIIFILLKDDIIYKINIKYIKESLNYSLPIIPVEIMSSINGLIDRYYIFLFIGLNGVGVYYIGVQIAGIINLIALAINSAYTPIFFQKYENNINDNYDSIYYLSDFIVFIVGAIASISIVLSPLVLKLFDKTYQESINIILYLGFTGAITSIYFINTNVLSLNPKLIKLNTIGIIGGTVINIVLSYFLTKYYGMEGAAISTLIGFTVTTIILISIVRRNTKFKFNNNKYLLFLFMLFLLLLSIKDIEIIIQVIIIVSLLSLVFFIGKISQKECHLWQKHF
jgi:O-antigen/teichoic acid export membrane protein